MSRRAHQRWQADGTGQDWTSPSTRWDCFLDRYLGHQAHHPSAPGLAVTARHGGTLTMMEQVE